MSNIENRDLSAADLLVAFDNTPENMKKLASLNVSYEIDRQTLGLVAISLTNMTDVRTVKKVLDIHDDDDTGMDADTDEID